MCEILDKLEIMTPNLPPISRLGDFKFTQNGITTYQFESGTAISEKIYSVADVAIAKTIIPKGTKFDVHLHEISGEWIIVLSGSLTVNIDGSNHILNKYDSIKIIAKEPHYAIAVEDTTIIAITIPRDDGFPE